MDDFKAKQGKHLQRMLKHCNTSNRALAAMIGVTDVTVSRWLNGKSRISRHHAELIHAAFPDYSIEYITGYSEYRNANHEYMAQLGQIIKIDEHIEQLVKYCGFTAVQDMRLKLEEQERESKLSRDEVHGWIIDNERDESYDDSNDYDFFEVIRDADGRQLDLTSDKWSAFINEICGYVQLRLNLMIERGEW